MTFVELPGAIPRAGIGVPTVPATPDAGARVVRFTGSGRAYLRLLMRGSVLLALTLGIYRFWLATDIRRFLWVNTEADGDSLEYTCTALESLIGFLIGIIPGSAHVISTFVSYAIERKISRRPDEFGKGAVAGVAGPE